MIALLSELNHWHWLAIGLILLLGELLGTAGYFLWLGISALLVSALMLWLPISWQLQWIAFASFSFVTTWLWWRRQLSTDRRSDLQRSLNQKDKQLIGQTATVTEDVPAGQFRLPLGDTTWIAQCERPIKRGERVKVVAVDGTILKVEPVVHPPTGSNASTPS